FARNLLDADPGDAAEERRRQRLPLRVDHLRRPGRQAAADRGDAPVLDQHVGALQGAARGRGVHGGVADQHVLSGHRQRQQRRQQQRRRGGCRTRPAADLTAAHRTPPCAVGCPSMKSVTGRSEGSARSYTRAPSTNTCSACAYTLKGLPLHSTTSPILPASRVPVTSSTPSALAAFCVIQRIARSGAISMPTRRAFAITLAASWLSRWMPSSESECTIAQPPGARSTMAMFSWMPSKASILKPHQSAHSAPQIFSRASSSASL